MSLPTRIRAEVKFTTGRGVIVPAREIDALRRADDAAVLAILFRSGDHVADGRWLLLDAGPALARNAAGDFSTTSEGALRASRVTGFCLDLRSRIDALWPAFLDAFLDDALAGRDTLVPALADAHARATVGVRLPGHEVLASEHLEAIDEIVGAHGEAVSGGLFQALFGYLLGQLGYDEITLNQIGVPDVEASRADERTTGMFAQLSAAELARIIAACRSAGEFDLARRLEEIHHLAGRSSNSPIS